MGSAIEGDAIQEKTSGDKAGGDEASADHTNEHNASRDNASADNATAHKAGADHASADTASADTASADTAIEVRGLVVERGRRTVLDGIDCAILGGRVTGLLGPSGSGKTTLIRAIVGVQIITSGTVLVLGRPAGSAPLRRTVGYVTQAPSVYADLSVKENARYFAAVHGLGRREADQAIADVGLSGAAEQLVGNLSGGQRSRASLACALIGAPKLLVLDEPTVGQDPVLRADLWARFHALAAAGTTLLVSSHVMDEAGRCDRLLLIREGRLIADDTPAAIRAGAGTDDLDEAFLRLINEQLR